ncbi:MAG: glycerol-3-phosphate dehydrogenase [Rhodospirillaceae bacterium]|nr:MAG: glycerol-3-phosphate dehydrogenase [Rhodospirillaceae bacterium]
MLNTAEPKTIQSEIQKTDLLIIGGGINGTGIARDASGRGLKVMLCEKGDLASATSSASTKLIHGGLRYLEYYEFKMVRAALAEREVLLQLAPHIVKPLRFILPHSPRLRPAWLIRLGLFLYDNLGKRKKLPGSGWQKLPGTVYGDPLVPGITKAVQYSDCSVSDSRLVVLNAVDASERGAKILTRTECVKAVPLKDKPGWEVTLHDTKSGAETIVHARTIVNATGPWAELSLHEVIDGITPPKMRLVKGSHIVVPRLFDHDKAYIFQNTDRRIVFAIPFEQDFTLIGTTDVDLIEDLNVVRPSPDEVDYLCTAINLFFKKKTTPDDVVWSFSGVRPLLGEKGDDAAELTRDYRLNLQHASEGSAALSVLGGKITTYRVLAEKTMVKLAKVLDFSKGPWTADAPLPGGDISGGDLPAFSDAMRKHFPWVPSEVLVRYINTYGTRLMMVLDDMNKVSDMGIDFGAGLYECEARYLIEHEWALTADDILWRRTKLGLKANEATKTTLQEWVLKNTGGDPT